MVRSTGSQPQRSVKRRGSKWHAAEAEDWGDREAFHAGSEGRLERAGGWGDHPSLDPARGDQVPATAQ
jgi:hypothetical protein